MPHPGLTSAHGSERVERTLAAPRPPPSVIPRPRLESRLDELSTSELTLISAPAGSGKTVLVESWCAAQPTASIAWSSLDRDDEDAVALWTEVATAIDRVHHGLGRLALERLSTAGVTLQSSVDELLNAMATSGRPLTIVLDDLHAGRRANSLDMLEYAIEHLPPTARVIATTRSDPPIALARLRARGQLGELRGEDLAFTTDEARRLLVERDQLSLDDIDLALLVERSEGWAAGLHLASLWLRGVPDVKASVRAFSGNHRPVSDYLTGEVLDLLDGPMRSFLVQTCGLGRFSAAMCDAVLGTTDAAVRIAQLVRMNLFIVPLDARGEWYRYHHLFAELLRMELALSDARAERALRRRASTWCRSHGLVEEAIEHAAASGDDDLVAELLSEHQLAWMQNGHVATLLRHIVALPTGVLAQRPELCATGAEASGVLSRPAAERVRLLRLAEGARLESPNAWTPSAQTSVSIARAAFISGDLGAATTHARAAVDLARAGQGTHLLAALVTLARALFFVDDHAGACAAAREAVARPQAQEGRLALLGALAVLGTLEAEAGRPHVAETMARRALAIGQELGMSKEAGTGEAHVTLTCALAGQGQIRQAEREAVRGEALCRTPEPSVEHAHALLVLAGIRVRRGRLTQAAGALERARKAITTFADPGRLPERAAQVEAALNAARLPTTSPIEAPSPAELAVLRLLTSDLSQREIGGQLYISLNTVKTHTNRIYRKLGATSREQAVVRASALGLLDNDRSPRAVPPEHGARGTTRSERPPRPVALRSAAPCDAP